jgi:hypothetical protein
MLTLPAQPMPAANSGERAAQGHALNMGPREVDAGPPILGLFFVCHILDDAKYA